MCFSIEKKFLYSQTSSSINSNRYLSQNLKRTEVSVLKSGVTLISIPILMNKTASMHWNRLRIAFFYAILNLDIRIVFQSWIQFS